MAAGAGLQIPVLLDWGYDTLYGRILNAEGYPVAASNIVLIWSHEQNGKRSLSRRNTVADEPGTFRFSRLGPGNHRLEIKVNGYKPVVPEHDVALQGSGLVVQLETN